jgi:hypothetical protein
MKKWKGVLAVTGVVICAIFLFGILAVGFAKAIKEAEAREKQNKSYIVVQYKYDGTPSHCWQIREGQPEIDLTTDHVRIKVVGDDFEKAAKIVDIDLQRCTGAYAAPSLAVPILRPGERP